LPVKDQRSAAVPRNHVLFVRGAGLLDEASGASDVEVLSSSKATLVLRRLAVAVCVLLLVGVLIAVRLFVHVDTKTDWAVLCIASTSNETHALNTNDYTSLYSNVTLAPCNETATVRLPPTTWAAYVDF